MESEESPEPGDPAVIRRRWSVSLVWLVPALAALIGVSMLFHAWLSIGPEISIEFRTAAGLEAGKTPVKFKDVTVGMVSGISLNKDGSRVIATVSLDKAAANLTRADTRFWVVRPRIGIGGVSGVDTLLSGAYIGVDRGSSAVTNKSFVGLERPPTVVGDMPGRSFTLLTEDLGSLDIGSPLYYRRVQVGRVASYQLDEDGKSVRLQIFIDAPYDRFVTSDTRFWNASGVDISLGADGFKVKTQSMATIVSGGIAFATPEYAPGDATFEKTQFVLSSDQASAMAPPDGPAQYIQLRFDQPLGGLSVGAPVLFSGVDMGKVVSVSLDYDSDKRRFPSVVGIIIYPQRLGRVLKKLQKPDIDPQQQMVKFLSDMVEHGLRAQVRSANLLTGQLYVSCEYVPNAPKVVFDESARPMTFPTVVGSTDLLQERLASIVSKIDKVPFEAIGKNLDAALANLDRTLRQLDGKVLPETAKTMQRAQQTLGQFDAQVMPEAAKTLQHAQQTLGVAENALAEDSPLQHDLGQTLREVQRAARSLRALADLLGRNPESLLRGRPDDFVEPSTPRTGQEPSP
ncbi:mammalian cell entry protein [Betaproteobacteria bacterium]|nr:mammalian cell entry protein [Betaproteobacteria bacterium]